MDISVIIPLYNKEKYIKRTLDSVLSQTSQQFEVVVIDDGSTDLSADVVRSCQDSRVKLFHQENAGFLKARNSGVKKAKGKLIAFIDADDQWMPEYLETMVRLSGLYPQAGAYGSAFKIIREDGSRQEKLFFGLDYDEGLFENYFKSIAKGQGFHPSAAVVRKDLFEKLGGFAEGMKDTCLYCMIAMFHPLAFTNRVLARYYLNTEDRQYIKETRPIDEYPLLEYIDKENIKLDQESFYYLTEYVNKKNLSIAWQYNRRGDRHKAKLFLKKSENTIEFRSKYLSYKKEINYPLTMSLLRRIRPLFKKRHDM